MTLMDIKDEEVNATYEKLKQEVEKRGYYLNADVLFTKNLIKGLLTNEKRYGYWACPCRLASGKREKDLDIICPCDYRDSDLNDFGCCYCSLYVTFKNLKDKTFRAIPERRNKPKQEDITKNAGGKMNEKSKLPVWRCKVCGYLCARDSPPDKCPICGVDKDRFERFE